MYIQIEYIWYTTPKYQYWFRAILRWFSNKKIPSETWTHPPTSIIISDLWNFFDLHSPLMSQVCFRDQYYNLVCWLWAHAWNILPRMDPYDASWFVTNWRSRTNAKAQNWGVMERTKIPNLRNASKGDSHPGSPDWESGIRPLNYLAPISYGFYRWATSLQYHTDSTAELPRSNIIQILPLSYLAPISYGFYRWATSIQYHTDSTAELPRSNIIRILPLSYLVPISYRFYRWATSLQYHTDSTAELPRSNIIRILPLSYLAPISYGFYRWATSLQYHTDSTAELPRSNIIRICNCLSPDNVQTQLPTFFTTESQYAQLSFWSVIITI